MSLESCLARDLPKPKPIRAPPCMRENIANRPTNNSSGSRYTSSSPRMLPSLTTVLTLAFLAVSALNKSTAYPLGYLVMTLSEFSVSPLPLLSVNRSCCSRSSICALLTLPLLIWVIATDVSTGL